MFLFGFMDLRLKKNLVPNKCKHAVICFIIFCLFNLGNARHKIFYEFISKTSLFFRDYAQR